METPEQEYTGREKFATEFWPDILLNRYFESAHKQY
jgi:hypothetical protein